MPIPISLWRRIQERFFSHSPAEDCPICHRRKSPTNFKVMVSGVEYDLYSTYCPECTTDFLNKYSTICAVCGRPILPGEGVARSTIGASQPFIHLTFDCCPSGGLYCGHWGKGKLEEFVLTTKNNKTT